MSLLPTYDNERRLFANRVVRCSGAFLRFICNSTLPLAELRGLSEDLETHDENLPALDGSRDADMRFIGAFFGRNRKFLQGMETPVVHSVICPPMKAGAKQTPATPVNGARAPNPRVCVDTTRTSYLYDKMTGASRFHIMIFGSDLRGPVRKRIARFSKQALRPGGFFTRFGGSTRFNVVFVVKALPHETEDLFRGSSDDGEADADNDELWRLRDVATLVYDDRSPDEDAHYYYGINHARGAIVVVRPDLWVGMSAWPEETVTIDEYFAGFLLEPITEAGDQNGDSVNVAGKTANGTNGISGHANGDFAAVDINSEAKCYTNGGFAAVKRFDGVSGHTNSHAICPN